MKNYYIDKDFLQALFMQESKSVFARVTLLNFIDESPVEQIEGSVQDGGSISVDGVSALRRQFNLTLLTNITDINDKLWGLRNKIKLEIGISNSVNSDYPSVCWFLQGIYVITAFSLSISTNSATISISGKDKMCLLDGSVAGVLSTALIHSDTSRQAEPIKKVIKELLHRQAQEEYTNINVDDVDETAKEEIKYKGEKPLYVFKNVKTNICDDCTLDGRKTVWVNGNAYSVQKEDVIKYEPIFDVENTDNPTQITFQQFSSEYYTVLKLENGDKCGYRPTDLIYPGKLENAAGETITSVLDKIKNQFTDYEYYYDIYGRFVFGKVKNYVYKTWNNIITDSMGQISINPAAFASRAQYELNDDKMVTSIGLTLDIVNLKNDFVVWGEHKDTKLPLHMHIALDKKPVEYRKFGINRADIEDMKSEGLDTSSIGPRGNVLYTTNPNESSAGANYCDWRHVIYAMAEDYYQFGQWSKFRKAVQQGNDWVTGITGYEQYYTDIYNYWPTIYDTAHFKFKDEVESDPAALSFWFNFYDGVDFEKYSVKSIGLRQSVISNNNINAMFSPKIPLIIFTSQEKIDYLKTIGEYDTGYRYFVFEDESLQSLFDTTQCILSAEDAINEEIYKKSYLTEALSINTLPLYNLEPNRLIKISSNTASVNGEYLVTKFTVPLNYNGTTSITASKLPPRLM